MNNALFAACIKPFPIFPSPFCRSHNPKCQIDQCVKLLLMHAIAESQSQSQNLTTKTGILWRACMAYILSTTSTGGTIPGMQQNFAVSDTRLKIIWARHRISTRVNYCHWIIMAHTVPDQESWLTTILQQTGISSERHSLVHCSVSSFSNERLIILSIFWKTLVYWICAWVSCYTWYNHGIILARITRGLGRVGSRHLYQFHSMSWKTYQF